MFLFEMKKVLQEWWKVHKNDEIDTQNAVKVKENLWNNYKNMIK